ncbi:MAG: 3-oxoacyl-ACP reductase FabG [Actinomycetia bacterium]|nr:3-oxoacyl-ACP reductase FabG [Actinomycetes bacterium]
MGSTLNPGGAPDNRIALVTGGSRGIGEVIVTALSADGWRVATLDRTAPVRPGVMALAGSVASAADVEAAFARIEGEWGPVGAVVANSGIVRDQLLPRLDDATWQEVIDVNLTGAYRVARRALRGMMRLRWGRFVFMGSVVALSGGPWQANYAASKAGLIGLARSIAAEFAPRGITSNVVTPGFIDTDMTKVVPAPVREAWVNRIPMHEPGTPEDVAAAVRFLCSPEARYITGAVIPVDGGLGMGH